MIEKLVNSKTRLKILNLFLSHIDDRYYLRELERMLDESLSPLRRQLVKLVNMGILIVEEEANLKYYRVNKSFEGLEELKKIVLEQEVLDSSFDKLRTRSNDIYVGDGLKPSPTKQFRYDLALLSFISIFVLITAVFVVYTNNKNMKQVARMIAVEPGKASFAATLGAWAPQGGAATDVGNGEMASKRWKVFPGNVPVLSDVEIGGEENSKEL